METRATEHRPGLEFLQSLGFLVAVCAGIVLSAAFAAAALHRRGACPQIQLSGRINPNDASEASLARLPGIGPTRARAIIVLRERLHGQDGRSPVFREPDDLAQVKGIGPATVAGLRPWLRFEGSPSDSNEPTAR